MAALARLQLLVLTSCLLLVTTTSASPIGQPWLPSHLSARSDPVITAENGTMYAIDPSTMEPVPQGSASDGSGVDLNASALIWLVWSFVVGVPLALTGIRFWRLTTAASLGIACVVCVWAAFVNTLGPSGISDLLLTCLVMGAFGLGFFIGLFNLGRLAGITFLALSAGFSIGVRIVLFRDGLLVPSFFVNWIIATVCAVIGFVLVVVRQRLAILVSSASVGTFLIGLGVDLVINKQKGMSTGLRFLFDRNNSHLVDLFTRGWHPPISTIIILAVSLALIPPLAYTQHRIFKAPFTPERPPSVLISEPRESGEPLKQASSDSYAHTDKKINSTASSLQALLDKDGQPPPSPSSSGEDEKRSSSRFSM